MPRKAYNILSKIFHYPTTSDVLAIEVLPTVPVDNAQYNACVSVNKFALFKISTALFKTSAFVSSI